MIVQLTARNSLRIAPIMALGYISATSWMTDLQLWDYPKADLTTARRSDMRRCLLCVTKLNIQCTLNAQTITAGGPVAGALFRPHFQVEASVLELTV